MCPFASISNRQTLGEDSSELEHLFGILVLQSEPGPIQHQGCSPLVSYLRMESSPNWSIQEHTLIYIMSNLSIYVRLGADVITEQQMFYGYKAGWGFQFLITLATFFIGFCLAGVFRSIVVVPKELVWPGVLSVTVLTTTLHGIKQTEVQSRLTLLYRYWFAISRLTHVQLQHLEDLSICFLLPRLLCLFLLVLVPRLYLPDPKLLQLPMLDQTQEPRR